MGLGFKKLLTSWNRKWLDELNRMLEELFDMKFINDNQISSNELQKNVIPVLFAESGNVPNYDTTTQTLDFKSESANQPVLFYGDQKIIISMGTTVDASLITTTTAIKLFFDTNTTLFSFVPWSTIPTDTQLQIGTMRRDGSKVQMPFTVTVDGLITFPAKTSIENDMNKKIDNISFNDLALKDYQDMFLSGEMVQGSIDTNNGYTNVGTANRIFTKKSYQIEKGTVIAIKDASLSFAVFYYSEDVSGLTYAQADTKFKKSHNQWFTGTYTVLENTYMRFMFKKNSGANLTPSSVVLKNVLSASFNGFSELQPKVIPVSKLKGLSNTSYCHFSFDDVKYTWLDLMAKKTTYTSLFDNPFLKMLKDMNGAYGAKFSLYVFLAEFLTMDATYKSEFIENSDWLKVGLHLNETYENYQTTTYQQAYDDYQNFVKKAFKVTGSYSCIDRMPRLQNFAFNEVSLFGMMEANCGVIGMLTADDGRNVTYLGTERESYLRSHDGLIDDTLDANFLSTDMRIENYSGSVGTTLQNNIINYKLNDMYQSIVIFSHEQIYYTGSAVVKQSDIEDACKFMSNNTIPFDYPQNKIDAQKRNQVTRYKTKQVLSIDFEQGNIDGNGYESEHAARIRCKSLYFKKGVTITARLPTNYLLKVIQSDNQNRSNVSAVETIETTYSFVSDGKKYYRFVLGKKDSTAITPAENSNVVFEMK